MKHERLVLLGQLLFLLVFVVLLFACQPYLTYDDLSEGAKTNPKIEKRLERFEKDAELAGLFIEARWACKSSGKCHMRCVWHGHKGGDPNKTKFKDIDDMVKWYRRVVKHDCGFVDRMIMW